MKREKNNHKMMICHFRSNVSKGDFKTKINGGAQPLAPSAALGTMFEGWSPRTGGWAFYASIQRRMRQLLLELEEDGLEAGVAVGAVVDEEEDVGLAAGVVEAVGYVA